MSPLSPSHLHCHRRQNASNEMGWHRGLSLPCRCSQRRRLIGLVRGSVTATKVALDGQSQQSALTGGHSKDGWLDWCPQQIWLAHSKDGLTGAYNIEESVKEGGGGEEAGGGGGRGGGGGGETNKDNVSRSGIFCVLIVVSSDPSLFQYCKPNVQVQ